MSCTHEYEYYPEIWSVKKDTIYAAIHSLQNGLAYTREMLQGRDRSFGRSIISDQIIAQRMETDIMHMERTLAMLRDCGPNSGMNK